ncbi:MAG: TspO/MBR family protein, partial [Candidatus Micrarchaeota archaeon]
FGLQLALNTFWSILFFGLHSPLLAFICIIALWCAIAATAIRFYQISRTAGLMLMPYLLWVSFASILNLSIWLLN